MHERDNELEEILEEVFGSAADEEAARAVLTRQLQEQVSALTGQLQRLARLLPRATAASRAGMGIQLALLRERVGGLVDSVEQFGLEPGSQPAAATSTTSSFSPDGPVSS
jgi:hypothetical protein